MDAIGKWILVNCKFANKPLVVDWDEVARLIQEGLTNGPVAERLHLNPTWLSAKTRARFYSPDSPHYSPELLTKSRENLSAILRERTTLQMAPQKIPINWDIVLQRINEGVTLIPIAAEQGINESSLRQRIKSKFLNQNSPDYNPQIAEKIRENASNASRDSTLRRWQDPEYRRNQEERLRRFWDDPEYRRRKVEESRARWEQEEYRQMMSEKAQLQHQAPGFTDMLHEKAKERWRDDPEFAARMREEQSERSRIMWADPEGRQRQMERLQEQFADPAERARMSEIARQYWENPNPRHSLMRSNFWEWIAAFPPEKQKDILRAINARDAGKRSPPAALAWIKGFCKFSTISNNYKS